MRKSFFLSILAVGALVAGCAKSEVVDTKFNEEIGFETYLGRDAQTRAAVAISFETAGMYGFYTAAEEWDADTKANLWNNDPLTFAGEVTPVKYWTNDDDLYTFLAYAPKDHSTITAPAAVENVGVANPTITYKVPAALADQIDVLYAAALNQKKQTQVPFAFHHALARLTVKASAAAEQAFEFRVKSISITGGFITEDNLALATGEWTKDGAPETTDTKYTFYNESLNTVALTTTATDYAGDNNYLMMIPVDFTTSKATLKVEYTTFYQGTESTTNEAEFEVTTNFEQGKAYAINLEFSKDVEPIKFDVSVDTWVPADEEQDEEVEA